MAPIEWKPEFSVGDQGIDHEHRKLIELVNQVGGAIIDREPGTTVEVGLGDLLQAISAHFALEEQQMRRAWYDRIAEHKADHERLLDVLRNIMDTSAPSPDDAPDRLVATLEAWFAGHFQTHDSRLHRRLGPHPPR